MARSWTAPAWATLTAFGIALLASAHSASSQSASYPTTVLADTPVAYWRLNEPTGTGGTAIDVVGSFNGTYFRDHERRASLVGEPADGSQYLNRTGSRSTSPYITMGDVLDDADEFTLEAWVNIESMAETGVVHAIANKNHINQPRNGFVLYVATDRVHFDIFNAGNQWLVTTAANIPPGQTAFAPALGVTYHIVSQVVYEGGNTIMRIWVDGVLRAERTIVGLVGAGDSNTSFSIGRWEDNGPDSVPQTYDGTVDEVAVYGTALPAARVQAHYEAGAGAIAAPPPPQTFGTGEGGIATHGKCACGSFADPVNTRTGAFTTQVDDLATPGTGVSFDWRRSYTSADPTVGRLGPGWSDSYAASLTVQANGDVLLHGEDGQQLYYTKQGSAFLGAAGSLSTLVSVAGGYELRRTDQVVYSFNAQGRLLSMKDRNNQGVTLAYDGQGRLATITDAAARQSTVSYNAQDLVSGVATQGGRSVSYGYTSGRLTSVTDVRGKPWTYTYDAGGRLATIVDPLTHTQVSNVYSADGRVQSQTDALQKETQFSWNATTEVATATEANQKAWKHDYDQGLLAMKIDPLDRETLHEYDADLNTDAVTSPTLQQTTMTYDPAGNLLTATAPPSLGSAQKTFAYNGRNDPTQVTDARGKVTAYTYTPGGNAETVTQDGIRVRFLHVRLRRARPHVLGRQREDVDVHVLPGDGLPRVLDRSPRQQDDVHLRRGRPHAHARRSQGQRRRLWLRIPVHVDVHLQRGRSAAHRGKPAQPHDHERLRRRRSSDQHHGCAEPRDDVHL